MDNGFFAILSRMKLINRWGLMRNVMPENLCEHTLQVAYISHALAALCVKNGKDANINEAVMFALYHDCSEIITGDMPTPVKYYNDDIKRAYKEIEQSTNDRLLELIDDDIRGEFAKYLCEPTDLTKLIVKGADTLAAFIKCIEEKNMGNKDFDSAYSSTKKKLKSYPLPEVSEFMHKYLPAFDCTLDILEKK